LTTLILSVIPMLNPHGDARVRARSPWPEQLLGERARGECPELTYPFTYVYIIS